MTSSAAKSPTPQEEVRVSFDPGPLADILAHGAANPDVEICGVLVGTAKTDARIHVSASIRGESAKEQGAHVTFTHDTWQHIHEEMDRHYEGMKIVGWYHTHPGFGVFLSEMDTFIHENFFNAPYQVALVYDPLAGQLGIFCSRDGTLHPIRRYFRGGRPVELHAANEPGHSETGSERLTDLEDSINRVDSVLNEQAAKWSHTRWITLALLVAVLGFLTVGGTFFYTQIARGLRSVGLVLIDHERYLQRLSEKPPTTAEAPEERPRQNPPSRSLPTETIVKYRVQNGDTLWRISEALTGDGNRWSEIWSGSEARARSLAVGEVLELKLRAESASPARSATQEQ